MKFNIDIQEFAIQFLYLKLKTILKKAKHSTDVDAMHG
jgi:hypothetical protein